MTHNSQPASKGFTLVEVVVVVAVVLLLSAIAVPLVTSYIEDGKRTKASAEVKVIGAAVTAFYKDNARWPARNNSGTDNTLFVLYSGSALPAANPFAANHNFNTWALNGTNGDVVNNHLLFNTPKGAGSAAYATSGQYRWRGPYVAGGVENDPWNRPYVINVVSGHSTHATQNKRLYVLSAGPNGVIDTPATALATTDIAGDDIGMIIHQRQ